MITVKVQRSCGTRMWRGGQGCASVILIFMGDESDLKGFTDMGTEDPGEQAVVVAKKILGLEGRG